MNNRLFIKTFFSFLGWIFLFATAQAEAAAKPILAIQHWQTSQGTPVYFVRAPELPMMDCQVIFTAGSANDGSQWGIASLTASLLNEGTKTLNADQIADGFDQVGAQFSSSASRDVTTVAMRSLSDPKYLTPALQIFKSVLSEANFPDTALARVKQQTLTALQQQQQNPFAVASNEFYKDLYPNHPYGHNILGTAQTVSALTQTQIQAFYQRYFVSSNAMVILVGNLSRTAAEKMAEQLMAALPKGQASTPLANAQDLTAASQRHVNFPAQQTSIMVGQLGIDRKDPHYFPLTVGNYLLGQMPLGSVLFQQIRDQHGLTYNVSSIFLPLTDRGPFLVALKTRAAETQQALTLVEKILQQYVTQGPEPAQLQLAQQNIINHFPLNLSTNDQIAATLAQMAINHRPLDYLDTYRDKVNSVTPEQVKQAFQTLIHPEKMLTVTVGQP
jgi:zinc protease